LKGIDTTESPGTDDFSVKLHVVSIDYPEVTVEHSRTNVAIFAMVCMDITMYSQPCQNAFSDSHIQGYRSLQLHIQGGPKKPDHFSKCITFLYNDIRRHSIYQNVQLITGSKSNILNTAVFKYSLHKVRETILH